MLMVGFRPGEVLGLEWPDLDSEAGVLHIERSLKRERGELKLGPTKTKRGRRVIALPEPVLATLAAHRRRQAKERLAVGPAWPNLPLLLPTSPGTLYDPSNFRREFNAICTAAGVGHWHPHELRRSAASLLSAAGVPLELVADVVGHQTTRTPEAVYRHTVLPAASGAVEAMDRMFGDQPG
jgi:integrase